MTNPHISHTIAPASDSTLLSAWDLCTCIMCLMCYFLLSTYIKILYVCLWHWKKIVSSPTSLTYSTYIHNFLSLLIFNVSLSLSVCIMYYFFPISRLMFIVLKKGNINTIFCPTLYLPGQHSICGCASVYLCV
jgi:hypothetical protein